MDENTGHRKPKTCFMVPCRSREKEEVYEDSKGI